MDSLVYWIWLSLCLSPDTPAFRKLYDAAGSAEAIYDLPEDEILRLVGKSNADAKLLVQKDLEPAQKLYDFCNKKGIGLLPFADERYPSELSHIENPPVLLYYRGKLPDFRSLCPIAIVGTRSMSDYGKKSAFHISLDLARAGATVVSGMALGIDGVALAAAVAAGKPTVAVLGCGIDICYPKEHLILARGIVENGCILTEYPPGTPPLSHHFPKRNRIISGLSCATIVIEGKEKSGALITARCAFAQGRKVYALPGSVDSETSALSHLLLRNGARVLTGADDVIRDLEFVYTGILNPYLLNEPVRIGMADTLHKYAVGSVGRKSPFFSRRERRKKSDEPFEPLASGPSAEKEPPKPREVPENLAAVYARIPETGDCAQDALVGGEIGVGEVMTSLLGLEIAGFIEMLPGDRVRRKP